MTYLYVRRRGGAVRALRRALGDANLLGVYVSRSGVTTTGNLVTQWDDARGATGFGPSFTASGTARPTLSNGLLVFDGVANALKTTGAALAGITGDCGVAFIGAFPTATATDQRLVELGDNVTGGTQLFLLTELATSGNLSVSANLNGVNVPTAPAASNYPGLRVLHGRRTNIDGSNTMIGAQVGGLAEATASVAATPLTAAVAVLGASRGATTNFAACTVSGLVLYKGNYAGKQSAVNAFAAALGALL